MQERENPDLSSFIGRRAHCKGKGWTSRDVRRKNT